MGRIIDSVTRALSAIFCEHCREELLRKEENWAHVVVIGSKK